MNEISNTGFFEKKLITKCTHDNKLGPDRLNFLCDL